MISQLWEGGFLEATVNLQQGHHEDDDENLSDVIAWSPAGIGNCTAVRDCHIEISQREEDVEYKMHNGVNAALLGVSDGERDELCDSPGSIRYYNRTHSY